MAADMNLPNGFTPRPGTKVSLAAHALLAGPMTSGALAAVMDCPSKSVNAMLFDAIRNDRIVKVVDRAGTLHFALAGATLDEQFSAHEGKDHASAYKPNPADPFGLVAKRTAEKDTPVAKATAQRPPPSQQHVVEKQPATAHAVTPSGDQFVAALFSSGELMISVGATSVKLSSAHQQQLRQYLAQLKEWTHD